MISQETSIDNNESEDDTTSPPTLSQLEERLICLPGDPSKDKESLTVTSSLSGTDIEKIESHPCYHILMSRKKAVRNKAYRIALIDNILTVDRNEFIHESYVHNQLAVDWYRDLLST